MFLQALIISQRVNMCVAAEQLLGERWMELKKIVSIWTDEAPPITARQMGHAQHLNQRHPVTHLIALHDSAQYSVDQFLRCHAAGELQHWWTVQKPFQNRAASLLSPFFSAILSSLCWWFELSPYFSGLSLFYVHKLTLQQNSVLFMKISSLQNWYVLILSVLFLWPSLALCLCLSSSPFCIAVVLSLFGGQCDVSWLCKKKVITKFLGWQKQLTFILNN